MKKEVGEMFGCVSATLKKNDTAMAKSALVNEGNLNTMQIDFRRQRPFDRARLLLRARLVFAGTVFPSPRFTHSPVFFLTAAARDITKLQFECCICAWDTLREVD